jgi:hypothetical protein
MYEVKFSGETWYLDSDEQLLEFVKTAVIRNKDISSFSVERVLKQTRNEYKTDSSCIGR